ncbi:MAG: Hsp20/alpha crystallin family protein [Saprospiraceae bacterium]
MLVKFGHSAKRRNFFADDFFTRDLDKFFKGFENTSSLPATNIKETEDAFEVELSVPGYNKEDFNLKLDNELLTISAKIEDKKEETTEKYTRKEFTSRSFSRTFTLPDTITTEEINAKYDSGILKVTLPKNKEVLANKHREISIS